MLLRDFPIVFNIALCVLLKGCIRCLLLVWFCVHHLVPVSKGIALFLTIAILPDWEFRGLLRGEGRILFPCLMAENPFGLLFIAP